MFIHYLPHPKDGGRYCFQFVCQFTPRPGGGYPIPGLGRGEPHPRSGWGVTLSQVWVGEGGTPSQVWGGTPYVPGLSGGTPYQVWDGTLSQVWVRGVPHPRSGWGVPWGTPWPGQDGVHPPTMTGWGIPPPHHDWMGYPPTMTGWGTPHHD